MNNTQKDVLTVVINLLKTLETEDSGDVSKLLTARRMITEVIGGDIKEHPFNFEVSTQSRVFYQEH